MSTLISTVVAPTSSIVAGSTPATRGDAQAGNTQTNAAAAASSPAAVVSLSSSSSSRSASHGDARSVDAAFEKQDIKDREKKEESGTTGDSPKSQTVNIAA